MTHIATPRDPAVSDEETETRRHEDHQDAEIIRVDDLDSSRRSASASGGDKHGAWDVSGDTLRVARE
jgi:hypothetical protein